MNNITFNSLETTKLFEDKDKNYTLLEIDNKKYAVLTKDIIEIIQLPELDYNASMHECVLGLLEYDKNPIPVIDLREILKKERKIYDLSSKVVIIKTNVLDIALICDRVFDIAKLDELKIKKVPYQEQPNFYDGIYIDNDENYYILNIENIFKYIEITSNRTSIIDNKRYIVDDENSRKVLKERKLFLDKVEQDIQDTTSLYDMGVTFLINDTKYYVNLINVKEFYRVNNANFLKVPSVPEYILGLVNIKGEYITVLDLRRFYSEETTTLKSKSTIIILNSDEFKMGILADEILENMNINFDEIIQNKLQKYNDDKMPEFIKDGVIYQILYVESLFKDDRLTIC